MPLTGFHSRYLNVQEQGDVAVVSFLVSHLTDDQNVNQLGRELFSLLENHGCSKIVLDLSNVAFATSSVLGKFITLHRKLHRHGGKLILCGHHDDLADVLETSKLTDYFNTSDSIETALSQLA